MSPLSFILLLAFFGTIRANLREDELSRRFTTDDSDFTFKFCDTNRPPCASCNRNGGAALVDAGFNTSDLFPDREITLTRDDLDIYRALNMEYVVEFSKNPPYSQEPLGLPYCHVDQAQSLSKRFSINDLFGKPPKRPVFRPRCLPTDISVTMFLHIVTSNSSTAEKVVTNEVIANQFEIIQDAFKPLQVSFKIGGITRDSSSEVREFTHQKTFGEKTDEELAYHDKIAGKLRQGGYDTLNVYIVEQIADSRCIKGEMFRTSGFCTFPNVSSATTVRRDGCFVDIDSLPGISWRGTGKDFAPGTGKTLVHEIGHWFNLRHVFHSAKNEGQSPTCQESDYQGVDTPFYKSPGQSEPFQKACCRFKDGTFGECATEFDDHVTNWMSYSSDRGKLDKVVPLNHSPTFPWTTGQMADLFTNFYLFRRKPDGVLCRTGSPMYGNGISFRNKHRKRDGDGNQKVTGKVTELLSQPPALLESLKTVCSRPIHESKGLEIDPVTGKLVDVYNDPFEWWYDLGAWRWIILAAAIAGLLAALACCIFIFRRWRRRKNYSKVDQGAEKPDDMRPLHLVQRQRDYERL